jgi:hypothetical protein
MRTLKYFSALARASVTDRKPAKRRILNIERLYWALIKVDNKCKLVDMIIIDHWLNVEKNL